MIILSLDLATKCGWAIGDHKRIPIRSGVWDLKPTRFESYSARFTKFRRAIELELLLGNIEHVVYEEVRMHNGVDAAHMYGGWLSILQTTCSELSISYEGVPVGTIKRHATGKGNADKEMMFQSAVQKFKGVNVIDHNHADALHLLDYATRKFKS